MDRTAERMTALVEAGAASAGDPADAARRAEVVITMVSDPEALRAVTEGPTGIAAGTRAGATAIEMSTVGPSAVERLASILPDGNGLLDAPVLGSLAEVESGTLKIFVGGPDRLVGRWLPLLTAMGSPMHMGPLGSGARAKLVANATLLGVLGVLGEALALGRGLGLSPETTFEVLAQTPLAAQAERRRAAFESGAYPPRFALSLARKDADVISGAAADSGVQLRVVEAVRAWLAEAERGGWGDRDYAAILAWIVDQAERKEA